jgi:eukaryotic-like serine/threonine-protein kinase
VFGTDLITECVGAVDEIDFLGRGSFGETYRIARGDDEFALKVIHHPDMPDHLWEREIEALRRVDHPNVVGFRGSGRMRFGDETYPFVECEYIDGGTVRHRILAGNQPASAESLRAFLSGLLAGVGEIHDLGILHRDIKPANVGLRDADWGRPVLLDFGLARVLDMSSHTEYPTHLGTLAYMAPEQLRGQPARRRSDLFAVGVVAYEGGTGAHPFLDPRMTSQGLHDRIQQGPLSSPGELNPIFEEDIETVVLRLLNYRGYDRLGITEAMRDLEGD